jgi:polyhydroxyalkanoate synthesis regulator phasin
MEKEKMKEVMKTLRKLVLIVGLGLVWLPIAARASEADVLLNKLVEKDILTASEAQEVRNEMSPELASHDKDMEEKLKKAGAEWAQKISINGDIRLRNETRDRTSGNVGFQRIRFRLGVKAKVSDNLEVGARFATGGQAGGIKVKSDMGTDLIGSSDPVSTNQTLSDTFAKKNFNLDQAYIKYSPETSIGTLAIWGGIFDNPFVATSLVWDGDLTFGGAALQWSKTVGPAQPFLNGGVFPIDSGAMGSDNPAMYGTQIGVTLKPMWATGVEAIDNISLKTAVAHYDFSNVVASTTLPNSQQGNTVGTFRELNPYVEITSQGFDGLPITLWGDWVKNTATPDQKNGSQFGIRIGKATTPWDIKKGWELGYFTQEIESNAAHDAFVDSDFGGGGTNRKGKVGYLTFATLKNSTATVKYLDADQITGTASHEKRIQVDWVTKF